MATIEEVVVRFTGDASSLEQASTRARMKTRDLEQEILQLNRIMERNKSTTSAQELNLAKLEKTTAKYLDTLEKIRRQEARMGGAGRAASAGGGGLSIGGSFAAGAGIAGSTALFQMMEPLLTNAVKKWTGLTDALRDYDDEVKRSAVLQSDQARAMSNRSAMESREAGQLLNPVTGQADPDRQAKFWRERQERTTRQIADANNSLAVLRRELIQRDTLGRHLPGVGTGQQMEFETAQRNVDEKLAEIERLKGQRDSEMNRAADLEAGGTAIERRIKEANRNILNANRQGAMAGLSRSDLDTAKIEQILADTVESTGDAAVLLGDIDKFRAKLTEEFKAIREAEDRAEVRGLQNQIRATRAATGFRGAEAEVLRRRALGQEVGNAERLELADMESAEALKQRLMTPFERGQQQLADLEKIRGRLDPETYSRAVAEIDKGMTGQRPAASRAATGYGSAEHTARILQYQRVLDQPQALANNIERVNRDKPPEGKAQDEANTYLRQIRDSLKKPTVELRPANFGGG